MTDFYKWVGLPYRLGADPRDGQGACCLMMAIAIHEELGLPMPLRPQVEAWVQAARHGRWLELARAFKCWTRPATIIRPGTMALTSQKDGGIGIATAVDSSYLLIPFHDDGVRAVPRRTFRRFHEVPR